MKKITRIDVSKIKKQSLRTYLYSVTELVALQDPSALKIEEFYNKLNDLKPAVDNMKVKYRPAIEENAELKLVVSKMRNVLRSIKLQVASTLRINYIVQAAEVTVINEIVARYMKLALKENTDPTENICTRMLLELESNAEIQVAIESLLLKLHFEELKRLIDEAVVLRKAILAKMQAIDSSITVDLRKQIAVAVSNLFLAIEIECERNTNLNYEPLVSSLNVLNGKYRAIQKAKATRLQTSTEGNEEATFTSSSQTNANVA